MESYKDKLNSDKLNSIPVYNLDNVAAKRGTTGKFYCGRKLVKCFCCNGYCGPTNGCNCSACRWLDIQQLPLQMTQQNRAGAKAILKNKKYYCGRKALKCGCCNGYCGTTSGCNCEDCKWLETKMKEDSKTNYEGVKAKRGTTGKFYCGRKNIIKCGCCNGDCGPTNGCNCNSCKWLDDQEKGTSTVKPNKAGVLASKGETGRYYCGKKALSCYCCNGYCGPDNGCSCKDCQELDKAELLEAERSKKAMELLGQFKGSVIHKDVSLDVLCAIAEVEKAQVHVAEKNQFIYYKEKGLHVTLDTSDAIIGFTLV